jgi:hypothetical protein
MAPRPGPLAATGIALVIAGLAVLALRGGRDYHAPAAEGALP